MDEERRAGRGVAGKGAEWEERPRDLGGHCIAPKLLAARFHRPKWEAHCPEEGSGTPLHGLHCPFRAAFGPMSQRSQAPAGCGAQESEQQAWLWGWGQRVAQDWDWSGNRHHLWLVPCGSQAPMTLA